MYIGKYYSNQFQMSYITRDMDTALAHAEQKLGMTNLEVHTTSAEVIANGSIQKLENLVSLSNYGTRQLEIIQPVIDPINLYSDALNASDNVLNFHHVSIYIPGEYSDWERFLDEVRESGDEIAMLFPVKPDAATKACFCYVDSRKRIGHYTEYLWVHKSLKGVMAAPFLQD